MVENLCVAASVLILVLAVSMLIPTRKRIYADASVKCEDENLSDDLLKLILSFAIESWKVRNTLRNQFETNITGCSNTAWLSLWNRSEELVPLSWIEPKTKLLTRQSLYSICEPFEDAEPTAWCFFAIWGSLVVEKGADITQLQQELGMREMAQRWSHLLGDYGLVAADENDCMWLAMPYVPTGDSTASIALVRTIYKEMKESQIRVNNDVYACHCRIRFTETSDSNNCEQTLKILLEEREQESPIQFYDGERWQAIDLETPATNKSPAPPAAIRDDGSVETSPAELSQLLAEIKTKPAAMCVKDKSDDTSTAFGVQIEECEVDEVQLNDIELKQEPDVVENELKKAEDALQQDLAEIQQSIESVITEPSPNLEVDPSEKVTADDIAKLFAAARANA